MMDFLNWLMAHWEQIAKLIGELIAALAALTTAVIGLCSILTKFIPILAANHPALPLVKAIGTIALNSPPVKAEDRPTSPITGNPGQPEVKP
jgi:hypothetical protein